MAKKQNDRRTPEADLSTLVQWFEHSEEMTVDARAKAERDRDYYDGKHYTSDEVKLLKDRKQPPISIPLIRRKVNFVLGYETQRRVDPKAYPRNYPFDEHGAQAATDAIRYVVENGDGDEKFSESFENLLIEGICGLEVGYNAESEEIELKCWAWDRLFYDPYSAKHDFSDALYQGGVIWLDMDRAKAKWPDKKIVIDRTVDAATQERGEQGRTYDDKPRNGWVHFGANRRNRVRIVQIYWREGNEWWYATYTKGGFLVDPKLSPYMDENGSPDCPMVLQSAYVDRENNRYGDVRELIDLQDEVNKRRSKALHLLNSRQVIAESGAVDDVETARVEIARPDGYVEITPNRRFDVVPTSDMAAGNLQLLQEIKQEAELAGPNAALSGNQEGSASGRAVIASQQGGIVALSRLFSRYKHFRMRVYRHIWNRVRQFWKHEKWVRITDDERNIKFIGINQKVTALQQYMETRGPQLQALQQRTPQIPIEMVVRAQMLNEGIDPNAQVIRNNVAEIDVDIIIDEAPDSITVQAEQFQLVTQMAQAGVPFAPEDIIELSSLRNKEQVLERMKERQQAAAQAAQQDPAVEIEQRKATASAARDEAAAVRDVAQARKTTVETQLFGQTPVQ